ncbi:MAG: 2-phosphosulfolactate phosphatase [Chloroflexota bacterium]|nr:2-phosphosulfolactate phosphatase [Chloroflexota bacterium]
MAVDIKRPPFVQEVSFIDIRIDSLHTGAQQAKGTVVLIDVFRAFTTAAIAFRRGAEKIIMTAEPEEALKLREEGIGELCAGEVGGKRPPGFDFGNSPFELSQAEVRGKTLIQSTRAGTVGVTLVQACEAIYLASLVNTMATAETILTNKPSLVTIVALGQDGLIRTDEDEMCALYLRNLLQGRKPDYAAIRSLVLTGAEATKYANPELPYFHPEDLVLALKIDSIDFAIQVKNEDGLLVTRPQPSLK